MKKSMWEAGGKIEGTSPGKGDEMQTKLEKDKPGEKNTDCHDRGPGDPDTFRGRGRDPGMDTAASRTAAGRGACQQYSLF